MLSRATKRQIFGREARAEALSYILIAFGYVIFQFRWWALVVAVPSILIAVILGLRPSKAPLSILSNTPQDSKREDIHVRK